MSVEVGILLLLILIVVVIFDRKENLIEERYSHFFADIFVIRYSVFLLAMNKMALESRDF